MSRPHPGQVEIWPARQAEVLVACEFSGIVRDAFIARGFDAVSVDLLPSERPGPHIIGDALAAIREVRPRLLIAHPPCTYLALSGVRWLYGGKGTERDPERWAAMVEAAMFFGELLYGSGVPLVAVENPIMHRHGRQIIESMDPAHHGASSSLTSRQIVQPWWFGHGETKATVLWSRGLPELVPTDVVEPEWAVDATGEVYRDSKGKRYSPTHYLTGRATTERGPARVLRGVQKEQWERIHRMAPGPDRWRERSRTMPGLAEAMADQWGAVLR